MNAFLVRPRVAELVFQLYGKPLHPELFDILAVRKFQREDYELRIWITRTGHVITWENEDVLLTEIADADQAFSEKRRFLREYRTRLIADVVTGKLDVRAAAAQLPIDVQEASEAESAELEPDEQELAAIGQIDE